jgi:hypothetical protein
MTPKSQEQTCTLVSPAKGSIETTELEALLARLSVIAIDMGLKARRRNIIASPDGHDRTVALCLKGRRPTIIVIQADGEAKWWAPRAWVEFLGSHADFWTLIPDTHDLSAHLAYAGNTPPLMISAR